ncbi:helix-turn-helix transcriptional regulator [Actinoplanes sp. TBRC 11911]|uniref:TetR/AcrR family transcriptional regulator n=1 Tax=Actinoplanes sp. TBRC 11911 TaxID=2729386 RepID=UPI00145D9EF1|nr:helix-turn-helix domain-containing protein [Actinoplanes sp. TBRC 11911]NMO51907.1 helix-turn-helix transcriptional regulator [Actinoplanes sp. TBRC 11911]
MRADAQTNRDRILDVAEEVFGKGGPAASTEEVARRAGVGIATVFRHFPTKAGLLEAVLVRRFDRLRERAEALLDAGARGEPQPGPVGRGRAQLDSGRRGAPPLDAGAAFFGFFAELVADAATKIAIGDALLEAGGDGDGEAARASNALRQAVGVLLRRAQQAGAVRDDVELPEVYALLVGTSRAAAHAHLDDEVTARMLAIVFDGLRAQADL